MGSWKAFVASAATVVAVLAFSFHFLLTFVYLTPINPLKLRFAGQIHVYMDTFFQQNWHLFAPSPIASNLSLIGKCRTDRYESDWLDLTAGTLVPLHENRFSSLAAHAHLQLNVIRMYLAGSVSTTDKLLLDMCAKTPDHDFCVRRRAESDVVRKRAAAIVDELVVDACQAAGLSTTESINIRIAELVFPRFSKRHEPDSAGVVSFVETGWRPAPSRPRP